MEEHVDTSLVRKKSGIRILCEKNRAFKAVPRHSDGATMTVSIFVAMACYSK